jgi:peptide/nickel transport system substrate-binding protein
MPGMRRRRSLGLAIVLACAVVAGGLADEAAAQTKPEGEMRWALYVTLSPVWFDPGELSGQITPFWFLYALHDALVKPMPGNLMSPSLAESWPYPWSAPLEEVRLKKP